MIIININRKSILIFSSILVFVFVLTIVSSSFGMQHYYKTEFSTALVTANVLNVRSGPGTGYRVIAQVNKNEYIRVFAGIGSWYIVQVEGDYIGAVYKDYVKPIYSATSNNTTTIQEDKVSSNTNTTTGNNTLTADELEVFNLINNQRTSNGLPKLQIDWETQRVARIKAQDMVSNNYFSHTSPTYGSPFDMLKSFKVLYKSAGENIAGNSSNSGAVNAWMNSSGHRANILNSSYNYTGIAVVSSPTYGKIYVQMFISR